MCGICGIYNFGSSEPVNRYLLKQMCDVITHRGPDDEGFFVEGEIGLGMRRLSIIDVAGGRQPICNEDKTVWIVYNGEIYNYLELRDELEKKGHRFRTRSDTETIVHLYEEYGEKCVNRLRGMFAFAIWDGNDKRLLLARDRVGIKPLSYLLKDGRIVFASEIKSILQDRSVERKINLCALSDYLTYLYVPSPKTIFAGIKKLPPGHILVHQNGQTSVKRYWDLSFLTDGEHSEEYYIEQLVELLRESVEIRLMSEVPLGAFLSGGIDSSTVVALMSQVMDQPVKTFSIGFEEEDFDELRYARLVAERFQTDHHEFIVKPDAMEVLPKLVHQFDEPFGDSSALPMYYLSRMAREYVTVCLSGDGGDEVFAGYNRYARVVKEGQVHRIPGWVRRPIFGTISALIPKGVKGRKFVRRLSLSPTELYLDAMFYFKDGMKENLLSDEVKSKLKDDSSAFLADYFEKARDFDYPSQLQYVDTMTYLPEDILTKVDRTSMLNSLETRVPLLDHRVMEFVATIPSDSKLRGGKQKYILKQSMERLLPEEVLCRQKKGFSVPLKHWFRGDVHEYVREIVLSKRSRERGLFNQCYVESLLNDHVKGRKDRSRSVWALLVFELWCQAFLN